MGIHDNFINKIIKNKNWEKIRQELTGHEDTYPEPTMINLGNGVNVVYGEGYKSKQDFEKSELFSKICWYINNGPGYCEDAPEEVKKYLRRVGVEV